MLIHLFEKFRPSEIYLRGPDYGKHMLAERVYDCHKTGYHA